MAALPLTDNSLLVRTYFGDESAWRRTLEVALAVHGDGVRVYVSVVDDETFDGVQWEQLRAVVQATCQHAAVLFVADNEAMREPYAVRVVDLSNEGRLPFRCAATHLWSVDNNLNLANMDWEEFATAVDVDGVYRGFD